MRDQWLAMRHAAAARIRVSAAHGWRVRYTSFRVRESTLNSGFVRRCVAFGLRVERWYRDDRLL